MKMWAKKIKNKHLRRGFLIFTYPVAVVLVGLIGFAACQKELMNTFRTVWFD